MARTAVADSSLNPRAAIFVPANPHIFHIPLSPPQPVQSHRETWAQVHLRQSRELVNRHRIYNRNIHWLRSSFLLRVFVLRRQIAGESTPEQARQQLVYFEEVWRQMDREFNDAQVYL